MEQIADLTRREIHNTFHGKILPPDHPISHHVRRVVSRILTASNLGVLHGEQPAHATLRGDSFGEFTEFGASARPTEAYGPRKKWDVIVVDDKKTINAMATPGAVVVFTGILSVCRDEEGLAAVLAHEIGHVVARHTAESISSQKIWSGVAAILQLLSVDYTITQNLTALLFRLPNSRTHEREADLIGLRLMSKACYDPRAALAMLERLGQLKKSVMPRKAFEFARTHPAHENRVKYLEAALPEAYQIVESNPECAAVRKQLDAFRETAHQAKIDEIKFGD
ncbi:hypothetical protein H1R20_g4715, partial [Candolleomyces eurysporus]